MFSFALSFSFLFSLLLLWLIGSFKLYENTRIMKLGGKFSLSLSLYRLDESSSGKETFVIDKCNRRIKIRFIRDRFWASVNGIRRTIDFSLSLSPPPTPCSTIKLEKEELLERCRAFLTESTKAAVADQLEERLCQSKLITPVPLLTLKIRLIYQEDILFADYLILRNK